MTEGSHDSGNGPVLSEGPVDVPVAESAQAAAAPAAPEEQKTAHGAPSEAPKAEEEQPQRETHDIARHDVASGASFIAPRSSTSQFFDERKPMSTSAHVAAARRAASPKDDEALYRDGHVFVKVEGQEQRECANCDYPFNRLDHTPCPRPTDPPAAA